MLGKEFPALMRPWDVTYSDGVAVLVGNKHDRNVDDLSKFVSSVRRIQDAETELRQRIKVAVDNQPNG